MTKPKITRLEFIRNSTLGAVGSQVLVCPGVSNKSYTSFKQKITLTGVLLTLVLLLGLGLRLQNLNWDENHHLHPDERWLTMVTEALKWPADLTHLFTPSSSLSPFFDPGRNGSRNFAYGGFSIYLLKAASEISAEIGSLLDPSYELLRHYDGVTLVGRVISALCDTVTIFFVFLIARAFVNPVMAVFAAALYASAVLGVQLSHFFAVDTIANMWITISLYFAIKLVQTPNVRNSLLLGAMSGLAMATKFSASPIWAIVVLAQLLCQRSRCGFYQRTFYSVLAGFAVYFLAHPYSIIDFPAFISSMREQNHMVTGLADLPYTRQYRRTDVGHYIENLFYWGMGPVFFIAAAISLLAAIYGIVSKKMSAYKEILLVTWVMLYAGIHFNFMVKYTRYLLPILPILAVIVGIAISKIKNLWAQRAGALIVLLATCLATLAFLNIYANRHTRVQASEWIYKNIPPGATITAETWDDPLPLGMVINGKAQFLEKYKLLQMPMVEPENPRKLQNVSKILEQADWIILSSNRMYGWIERLKDAFPMTAQYYQMLFHEQLGFKKVAQFKARPALGPLEFDDDDSDESFTVYDHPVVTIFQKTKNLSQTSTKIYSEQDYRNILSPNILSQGISNQDTFFRVTKEKSLLLKEPNLVAMDVEPHPWLADNSFGSFWLWWALSLLLGVCAFPLVVLVFSNHMDRGWGYTKLIGFLMVGWMHWQGVSWGLWENSIQSAWCVLGWLAGLTFLLSILLLKRYQANWKERVFDLLPIVLKIEALYFVAFTAFAIIRSLNPDLWQPWTGGEKMMEYAFFNATMKSPTFPPYDPYFAGGTINYYYYGLYLVGLFTKMSFVQPDIGYNLGFPLLFALATSGLLSIGTTLSANKARSLKVGLIAVVFVLVIGNLESIIMLLEQISNWPAFRFDFWRPSRVIPFTINEFPFWSFLFADLHPHLIDIPFVICAIGLGWELYSRPHWMKLGMTTFVIGNIAVINTWDAPAFFGLTLGLYFLRSAADQLHKIQAGGRGIQQIWIWALMVVPICAVPFLFFKSYFSNFAVLYSGLEFNTIFSPFLGWIKIWGFFIFLSVCFFVFIRKILIHRQAQYVAWLMFLAFGILGGIEIFHLKDFLAGGEYQRMNTVFKFGMQAWILLGLATAASLPWVVAQINQCHPILRGLWKGTFVSLLCFVLIYPVFGTPSRIRDRFPPHLGAQNPIWTLRGLAHMETAGYTWPNDKSKIVMSYDLEAINWINKNISKISVIAEAVLAYYREGALRIATFTGNPNLMGMHQSEQRYGEDVGFRDVNAKNLFKNPDVDVTIGLIKMLKVDYIYFGQLESIEYGAVAKEKLESMVKVGLLSVAYSNPKTTLYQVTSYLRSLNLSTSQF